MLAATLFFYAIPRRADMFAAIFRRTLAIVLGRAGAVHLLSVILTLAYLSMISLIAFHIVPWTAGAALLALPPAIRLRWCFRHGAERMDEIIGMKWAAWHHWVFGLLFVFGISL
ncbi:hypothetical protein ETC01_04845 [Geobacillus sp. NFOSA3]|uniref:hypothetical protein n=1 Tax=Anoxybacillaceae TaxID=3120669 RepID=UPI0010561EF0|nr:MULTISPECIES: hypothetical protein [Bacillaceae]NNU92645.1 hypothetical protein [Geobacillus sp. NFOSA3]TXK90746.1 hypothetical protein FVE24_09890 [Parageobacillus sp. SY1]MED4969070.1 hypothetical protein [Parageobacillus toebii]TXK88800.1 hypothetical protein FVE68_02825 [Geobacillus sp. AYS3]WMT20024.1 hypothetical protein RFB12_05400 [Parageobacillus toebii]